MKKKYRSAIFDIDGTLLDSMGIWSDAGAIYLSSIGIKASPELGSRLFTMTLEEGADYIRKFYALSQSNDEIIKGVLSVVENFYRNEVQLKKGRKALLEELTSENIPMYLATTGNSELASAALKRLEVLDYFSGILTVYELNTNKHEPVIYQEAAKRLGFSPQETAVFEDVLHAVKTAEKAGFYVIGVLDDASKADWEEIKKLSDEVIY